MATGTNDGGGGGMAAVLAALRESDGNDSASRGGSHGGMSSTMMMILIAILVVVAAIVFWSIIQGSKKSPGSSGPGDSKSGKSGGGDGGTGSGGSGSGGSANHPILIYDAAGITKDSPQTAGALVSLPSPYAGSDEGVKAAWGPCDPDSNCCATTFAAHANPLGVVPLTISASSCDSRTELFAFYQSGAASGSGPTAGAILGVTNDYVAGLNTWASLNLGSKQVDGYGSSSAWSSGVMSTGAPVALTQRGMCLLGSVYPTGCLWEDKNHTYYRVPRYWTLKGALIEGAVRSGSSQSKYFYTCDSVYTRLWSIVAHDDVTQLAHPITPFFMATLDTCEQASDGERPRVIRSPTLAALTNIKTTQLTLTTNTVLTALADNVAIYDATVPGGMRKGVDALFLLHVNQQAYADAKAASPSAPASSLPGLPPTFPVTGTIAKGATILVPDNPIGYDFLSWAAQS